MVVLAMMKAVRLRVPVRLLRNKWLMPPLGWRPMCKMGTRTAHGKERPVALRKRKAPRTLSMRVFQGTPDNLMERGRTCDACGRICTCDGRTGSVEQGHQLPIVRNGQKIVISG